MARTRERWGPAAAKIVQVTAALNACSSASSSINLRQNNYKQKPDIMMLCIGFKEKMALQDIEKVTK